jgi:hypothetical protein
MSRPRVISVETRKAALKRKVRAHLKRLGFRRSADGALRAPSEDKESYRAVHRHQRVERLASNQKWLDAVSPELIKYFADGQELDVDSICPRLELAPGGSFEGDLFRFASLYWSIPVSEGYGRRMRFLVWDDSNGKLIGLIALGDAVFNLKARDEFIGWDHKRREQALVNLMDAYVLGALPPYNRLLGGKLVASLIATREVVDTFRARYRDSVGVISGETKSARLAAITTTSALGRSSIYNRLRLNSRQLFESIGYTSGWGHFHFSDELFEELREYLAREKDSYAGGFKYGQGPNWRLRVIKRALVSLGLDPDIIRHGFPREVFFCPIASNAIEFLKGKHMAPRYNDLPTVGEVSAWALDRWIAPRAQRVPDYVDWTREQLLLALLHPQRSMAVEEPSQCTGR